MSALQSLALGLGLADAADPSSVPLDSHRFGTPPAGARPRVLLLDSASGIVDSADSRWWPVATDSSSTTPPARPRRIARTPLSEPTSADQIARVADVLGFNKRQLGEIFGVSRQAIYDWLKGGNIGPANRARLAQLSRLLSQVLGDRRRPLYYRFTTEPVLQGQPSLLELLRHDPWDATHVMAVLREALDLSVAREASETATLGRQQSEARAQANLDHNLLSVGEE